MSSDHCGSHDQGSHDHISSCHMIDTLSLQVNLIYVWELALTSDCGVNIKTHDSESRGQEEAGLRDE